MDGSVVITIWRNFEMVFRSRYNKNNKLKIPVGTFVANVFGSFLLTVLLTISAEVEDPRLETLFIEATTKGFCGCLSTVSSFVGELFALRRAAMKDANDKISTYYIPCIYFFLTLVVSQVLSSIPNSIYVFS